MKKKDPKVPATNGTVLEAVDAILHGMGEMWDKIDQRFKEQDAKIDKRFEEQDAKMENGFAKLDRKIDNLAANTPSRQEIGIQTKPQN